MQTKAAGKIKGIDVSHHNEVIDWAKVKESGISFVYVKATEGVTYTDPMFLSHVKGAMSVGLPVGAYHFGRPKNDPIADAKNFVTALQKINYSLLPVLDLEVTDGKDAAYIIDWAKKFVAYVEQATKHKVMLYTGVWFINQNAGLKGLENMPLWVAIYKDSCPDAGGWNKWTIWQYTDKGQVAGINGYVDMDIAESLDSIKIAQPTPVKPQPAPVKPTPKPTPVKPVKPKYVLPQGILKFGMSGTAVKQLQVALNAAGFPVGKVDGVFGAKTLTALKNFQKANKLTADGVYGPATRAALDKKLNG